MNTFSTGKELTVYRPVTHNSLADFLKNPLTLTLLLGYFFIFSCAAIYLNTADRYSSRFSLVLPTAASSSKVNLQEVGQVSQSSGSAFGNQSFNPLNTYKQILMSGSVRSRAAQQLSMDPSNFSKAKIKIIQQTSIIDIELSSLSAELAQQKALALFETFQIELDRLRLEESMRRKESVERLLDGHRTRLAENRRAIVDFQQTSLMVSTSQLERGIATLAKIREDLAFAKTERESIEKYLRRLSSHLGVSPELAGYALSLQSDTQFAAYVSELQDVSATLSRYQSQWGQNHPKVVAEQQRFNNILLHLQDRSTQLVGVGSARILHEMNLGAAVNLSELFAEMLESGARLSGTEAKINELILAEKQLDNELRVYSREYSELEQLERDQQRAEAIYNAAAAELENGATNLYSSYPLVQMLAAPDLPLNPAAPKLKIAIAVSAAALFFLHVGVFVLWHRDRIIHALLKN